MKLHNIYVISKMVKKVVIAFDFSKASGVFLVYFSGDSEQP